MRINIYEIFISYIYLNEFTIFSISYCFFAGMLLFPTISTEDYVSCIFFYESSKKYTNQFKIWLNPLTNSFCYNNVASVILCKIVLFYFFFTNKRICSRERGTLWLGFYDRWTFGKLKLYRISRTLKIQFTFFYRLIYISYFTKIFTCRLYHC